MFHKYCDVKNDDLISFEDVEWDGISQQPKIAEDSDEIRRLKKLVEDLTKQVDIYKKRYENMWKVYKELAGSPFASTEKRASSTTENSVADKKVNIRDYFEPLLDLADAQSRSPVPTPPSHLARNTKVGEPNKAAQQAGTILVLEDIEPQEDRLFETSTKEEVRTSKSPDEKIEKLEDFFRFEAVVSLESAATNDLISEEPKEHELKSHEKMSDHKEEEDLIRFDTILDLEDGPLETSPSKESSLELSDWESEPNEEGETDAVKYGWEQSSRNSDSGHGSNNPDDSSDFESEDSSKVTSPEEDSSSSDAPDQPVEPRQKPRFSRRRRVFRSRNQDPQKKIQCPTVAAMYGWNRKDAFDPVDLSQPKERYNFGDVSVNRRRYLGGDAGEIDEWGGPLDM